MLAGVGIVCFVAALAFGVAAVQHRKRGVPLQPSWLESPLNHLFSGGAFTSRGQKFRFVALVLTAAGVICIILQQLL